MGETRVARRLAVGMVTLRGDLADPRIAEAVRAETGCAPPAVRRIETAGASAVAWMSPDELLLFGPSAEAGARVEGLGRRLAGVHHLAVDVSDARAVFRIEGPGARAVLARGAPVDLAPDAFGPGDFRRTRLGQVACAFWATEEAAFELMCFRSVVDYVSDWLAAAASSED